MDESWEIRKSDMTVATLSVKNLPVGLHSLAELGLTAGRQSGRRNLGKAKLTVWRE